MTDETDGKPRPFDKMHAGLMEALEYAKTDPMAHVTIPTADLTELLAAAEECAGDLATKIEAGYSILARIRYPEIAHEYERDMAPVRRLRAAVEKVRAK